jgi:antitoxin component YwqK of YwqJK toxin-antitoxin module
MGNDNECICVNDIINKVDENGNIIVTKIRKTYKNGIIIEEKYLNDKDEFYRDDDLPARITYFESGRVNSYTWYKNNVISRNDNPAFIEYFDVDGDIIRRKTWYKNGNVHRNENLSAYVRYDINGNIKCEQWYQNGKLHRTDGPAFVDYEENKIIKEEYYSNGIIVEKSLRIIDEISKFDEEKIIKCLEILKIMGK